MSPNIQGCPLLSPPYSPLACFHDLSRLRVPIDHSLTYPFVAYIASLIMTISDQFMAFDVVPSHALPYGYSMGPQATMSSYTASTATAKGQNTDRAPFIVVVFCTSFSQSHLCRYWKTVTDKLKNSFSLGPHFPVRMLILSPLPETYQWLRSGGPNQATFLTGLYPRHR